MNSRPTPAEEAMPALLDRLAGGDLDETSRGDVLRFLEEDPLRWRQCGLAFLEAQAWSLALADWPCASNERCNSSCKIAQAAPEGAGVLPSAPVRRTLIAAALFVAFGLGITFRDVVIPPKAAVDQTASAVHDHDAAGGISGTIAESQPILASLNVQSASRLGSTAPIRIPVVPAKFDLTHGSQTTEEIPDYVRQQWERRGYKVSVERRFIFARLPDGQQVVVPVEQLRVNSTPIHIN